MATTRSKPIFYIFIFFALLVFLLGSAVFVRPAFAQAAGSVPANAVPVEQLLNPDGTLNLATGYSGPLDTDGYDVRLDPARGPLFRPLMVSGTWNALGTTPLDNGVFALVVSGTDVYVGGNFTDAGGDPNADRIAKWDGSAWSALGATPLNNPVWALAANGTDVYVGGDFTDASGDLNADYLAKWDGSAWSALGATPLNNSVYALAVSGTDVYVGGQFTDAGEDLNADYLAKWDGSAWSTLGATPLNNAVYALATSETDVYVGGEFTDAGGDLNADHIAKWDGSAWSGLQTGLNFAVYALAVSGTDVYAGGFFTDAGSNPDADYIAKWDGVTWSALGATPLNDSVHILTVNGMDVYAGGAFTNAGGDANADYIAKWDGTAWSALGTGLNNNVEAFIVSGTDVYAGGSFTDAGGDTNADYLAQFEVDATAPTVDSFTVPASSTSFNIPITAFTASDNHPPVASYLITESDTPPSASDPDWTTLAPTTYTVTGGGNYTLYPWAKDADGNVSAVYGSPASVTVCDSLSSNTVTSTNDSGPGSLRQAIADACTGVTIDFNDSLSGQTIPLTSIQLEISKNVTIDGHALASKITISGNSSTRVFVVDVGVTATLDSLIVTQGRVEGCCGAGLLNYGTLTITNSLFSANTNDNGIGGAIMNTVPGTLTLTGSTISGNSAYTGGGIGNDNQMTITNSTISANSSGDAGGGIYNNGAAATLTVTNSTFSGNSAAFDAGGIAQDSGTLNISNTIIANSITNSIPGGDCYSMSTLGVNLKNLVEDGNHNCSFPLNVDPNLGPLADNGGPTQTFVLLANSPAIDAGDDATCAAAPVSNLDQRGIARPNGDHCDIGAYEHEDTGAPTVTTFTVPSSANSLNVPITTLTAADDGVITAYLVTESSTPPTVGAAGWTNSAPATYSVASAGNHTLYPWAKDDAGNVSALYGSPASVDVCLSTATVTSNADSGVGTLRQAISDACDDGTINFHASLSGDTIHLASTLDISKSLTIDGSALAAPITISGDTDSNGTGDVRVFHTTSLTVVTITLNSLIITKGLASGPHLPNRDDEGGGVLVGIHTVVNVVNSIVSDNAAANGGAISVYGTANISASTFSGNSSSNGAGGGGAILNSQVLTIKDSTAPSLTIQRMAVAVRSSTHPRMRTSSTAPSSATLLRSAARLPPPTT